MMPTSHNSVPLGCTTRKQASEKFVLPPTCSVVRLYARGSPRTSTPQSSTYNRGDLTAGGLRDCCACEAGPARVRSVTRPNTSPTGVTRSSITHPSVAAIAVILGTSINGVNHLIRVHDVGRRRAASDISSARCQPAWLRHHHRFTDCSADSANIGGPMSRVAGRFILWSLAMSTAYVTVVNSQGRGGQTQPSPYVAPANQVVAVRAGRLFDAKSGTMLPNQIVLITGD